MPAAPDDGEPLTIVDYDPVWPATFEAWRRRIVSALPRADRVDHIGSTAVPGLRAKPIVDIQVSVRDVDDESSYVPGLESLGLQLAFREEGHRFLWHFTGRVRDLHVHVCTAGSAWERRHLVFRDHLRRSPEARAAYVAVKLDALDRFAYDRPAYTDAKTEVIERLVAEAEPNESSPPPSGVT